MKKYNNYDLCKLYISFYTSEENDFDNYANITRERVEDFFKFLDTLWSNKQNRIYKIDLCKYYIDKSIKEHIKNKLNEL